MQPNIFCVILVISSGLADDDNSTELTLNNNPVNVSRNFTTEPPEFVTTTSGYHRNIIKHFRIMTNRPMLKVSDFYIVANSLELQQMTLTVLLLFLVIYIGSINFVAIVTLSYGLLAPSNSLAIRMVCLKKRPIMLNIPRPEKMLPQHHLDGSPTKASVISSSTIQSSRRAAVIATNTKLSEENMQFDSSAFPYLLSLAISDFLIGAFIAPLQLDIYINKRWRFSSDWCDFWLALDILFSTSSTLHTAAIAVDRWWTITCIQTKQDEHSYSLQKTMLIFIWMLASLVSFPVIYLWQIETPGQESRQRNPESCQPVADDTYILLSAMVSFCLPLILTVIFYVHTAMRLRKLYVAAKLCIKHFSLPLAVDLLGAKHLKFLAKNRRKLEKAGLSDALFLEPPSISAATAGTVQERQMEKLTESRKDAIRLMENHMAILSHHRRMLRAMIFIVIVYCICWTPLYTCLLFKAVCQCITTKKAQHTWGQVVTMLSWLGYANSGINPLIYFAALPEFRILAKAIVWVIYDSIKHFVISIFIAIGNYFLAVFCCRWRRSVKNNTANKFTAMQESSDLESGERQSILARQSTISEISRIRANDEAEIEYVEDVTPKREDIASEHSSLSSSEEEDYQNLAIFDKPHYFRNGNGNKPAEPRYFRDSNYFNKPQILLPRNQNSDVFYRSRSFGVINNQATDDTFFHRDFYRAPFNDPLFTCLPVPLPIVERRQPPKPQRRQLSVPTRSSQPNLAKIQLSKFKWDSWGRQLNKHCYEATV